MPELLKHYKIIEQNDLKTNTYIYIYWKERQRNKSNRRPRYQDTPCESRIRSRKRKTETDMFPLNVIAKKGIKQQRKKFFSFLKEKPKNNQYPR